jgi:hypothetical protein
VTGPAPLLNERRAGELTAERLACLARYARAGGSPPEALPGSRLPVTLARALQTAQVWEHRGDDRTGVVVRLGSGWYHGSVRAAAVAARPSAHERAMTARE